MAKHSLRREVRHGKVVYVEAASHRQSRRRHPRRRPVFPHVPWGLPGLGSLAIAGSALVTGGLIWLSWQVMVNPDVDFWLMQFLPMSSAPETNENYRPQTLAQIQDRLRGQNLSPSLPIELTTVARSSVFVRDVPDVLIPIAQPPAPNCQANCQPLLELQTYRALQLPMLLRLLSAQHFYRLLERRQVRGPTALDLAVLTEGAGLLSRSERPLPLSRIQRLEPAPKPGLWLLLSGLSTDRHTTATYGQVLYFPPRSSRFRVMLNWVSPRGEFPRWQAVTGNEALELVVNQSVGLEPDFAVYQLQQTSSGAEQLQRISLANPAIADAQYEAGVRLAQQRLWSPALAQLKALGQSQSWPPQAQAQFALIQLHAQVTHTQAEQAYTDIVERIVAYLINGSWSAATDVLTSASGARPGVRQMLLADSGRLQSRVEAALAFNPQQTDAIAWGAMLMHMQRSPAAALTWARQKTAGNGAALQRIQTLLRDLETPGVTELPTVEEPLPTPTPAAISEAAFKVFLYSAFAPQPPILGGFDPT
ncbi:hypothetical protein GS597_04830 [Synechococcales cyanobacterium C]|uniref:Uncharacterized protein n=1 Tax=Petrachloros mirabilis ULC683 TaxID=2781853 RepID=A0A8K2A7A0_9CYAN|nr:hypothetical protein [Petrachloros mirabilis]NCJ05845.1 hypothetical protein [Petrachloros mirabilis ULC683]